MKRYKLGQRRTKTDAHGNSATMPDMIECDNGEYIKYSEYEQLLESIGAGGVSGRVTQPDSSNDELCQSVIKLIEILEDWHEEFPDHVGDKEMPAIEQARVALSTKVQKPEKSSPVVKDSLTVDHIPDASKMMHQIDELDEREAFEAWSATQSDSCLIAGGLTWSPGTNDYASARTNAAFSAWQARSALAKQNTDKVDAARKEPTK